MLSFDTNHQYVEGNINEKNGKKKIKNIVIAGLIIANLFTFSGCSKNVPCDISGDHAHYYVNDDDFGRYIVSEKSSVSGLNRSDDYTPVNKEEAKLLKFINKNGLFRIDENQQAIRNITDSHQDFVEYRYKYYYLMPIPVFHRIGNSTYITYNYIPMIAHSWTTDTSQSLTGEERVCHYVYYGYKVIRNEKGSYELVKSDPVDDLSELPDGYDYIKEAFYDVVNLYDKNEILDYEDGPKEDKEIISEEEYSQSQGKPK